MKIGIDLRVLPEKKENFTGVANYAFLLTKYLLKTAGNTHQFVFFINDSYTPPLPTHPTTPTLIKLPRHIPFIDSHFRSARVIRSQNLDIFHSPAFVLPLTTVAGLRTTKTVITVHDLAIYKHPEWFPGGQWFSTKVLVPRSIKKADHIIVPSQSTMKDLLELFGEELALRSSGEAGEKVSVIPLGVEERFFRRQHTVRPPASSLAGEVGRVDSSQERSTVYGLRSTDYILTVATLEPRKNITRLIRSYAQLPKELRGKYDLVIAGGKGWKHQSIKYEIRNTKYDIRRRIKLLGSISSDVLPQLYQHASLFVFPSLYEGFGLPVLEALASGVPVITSNISSLPEVVGEAGILIDPYKIDEISAAMNRILLDKTEADRLAKSGIRRARQFTWENTAELTNQIYRSMI